MRRKKYPLAFEDVIEKLRVWHEEAMVEIRSPETHEQALQLKRHIEAAIQCLELCQRYQIQPTSEVVVLPMTQTAPPFSSYRICEDHETDKREYWVELKIDGDRPYFYPGNVIILNRRFKWFLIGFVVAVVGGAILITLLI